MRIHIVTLFLCASLSEARADYQSFGTGSLIIPMDTTYQDHGMLRAYGLVYALLYDGVPIHWTIEPTKAHLGVDFTANATDHQTGAAITAHGYRGGPFVIDASDAAAAIPIVNAWQTANPNVKVHDVTAPFTAYVKRRLVSAPTIAVFADGNETIAFGYLNAAGIPDSLGNTWPTGKQGSCTYLAWPDVLCETEVAGGLIVHNDGDLFDAEGTPVFCQMMSMHWNIGDADSTVGREVVAEYAAFLEHPVHLFAECQAVNAIENNVNGKFLTPNGFEIDGRPSTYDFYNDNLAFAQIDGAFLSVGGSEPSYSLPPGDIYHDTDVVMISGAGDPRGVRDVWMTGYKGGGCSIIVDDVCFGAAQGKVSYLGGHKYSTALPVSGNPSTNGTRLFLNSLFEADCAADFGQPVITLSKAAPEFPATATITFDLTWTNTGSAVAMSAVVEDVLPAGVTVVSITGGGVYDGTRVTWNAGNLASSEGGTASVTLTLPGPGTYLNQATISYRSGTTPRVVTSNETVTYFGLDQDGDGLLDADEIAMGTDVYDSDTDDDGVMDGDEIDLYGTDPFDADTDGDGHQDGTELGFVIDCLTSCHMPPRCASAGTGGSFVPDPDCTTTSDPLDPSDPAPPPGCGDGSCNGTETCADCAIDCGTCPPVCGDAFCQAGETCASCSIDCGACPPVCGDGSCDGGETCGSCETDCGACPPVCGDGSCDGGETCGSCETDCGACPPVCGDGSCDGGETCASCEADCGPCPPPPVCGDGTCAASEACSSCPADCGPCAAACGNTICELGEACDSCAFDCGSCAGVCADGVCDSTESCASCETDCGACAPGCGDGACVAPEDCSTCSPDCGACAPTCGNAVCEPGEACGTCVDCGECPGVCGDGRCDVSEGCGSCALDCPPCPAVDAGVPSSPDAGTGTPDAGTGTPDAATGTPDAATGGRPDADREGGADKGGCDCRAGGGRPASAWHLAAIALLFLAAARRRSR